MQLLPGLIAGSLRQLFDGLLDHVALQEDVAVPVDLGLDEEVCG